jgi:hypothetical protein
LGLDDAGGYTLCTEFCNFWAILGSFAQFCGKSLDFIAIYRLRGLPSLSVKLSAFIHLRPLQQFPVVHVVQHFVDADQVRRLVSLLESDR